VVMHIRDMKKSQGHGVMAAFLCLVSLGSGVVQAGTAFIQKQISPMRQDSIKMSSVPEIPRASSSATDAPPSGPIGQLASQLPISDGGVGVGYDPSGRRDPFAPVVLELQPGRADVNLPPLQRVTLTELNLIAVVWGAYGYTAMVQTPEGHGYTVRRGTRIGQNNGVVSAITERGIIVQERFTDVYGKKQEREYVKLLHPKEGSE
jgi:type IV pilus assembly protein PilP